MVSLRSTALISLFFLVVFSLTFGACKANHISQSSVTQLIGPKGGTLVLDDGLVVVIPAGALTVDTQLTASEATSGYATLPTGETVQGHIFELSPLRQTFQAKITIYMPPPAGSTAGVDPWVALDVSQPWGAVQAPDGIVNPNDSWQQAAKISIVTQHFGFFTLLRSTGDAGTDAGVPGCMIGGTAVAANAPNPANVCQVCKPTSSTEGWTNVTDGASCGMGQVCGRGACAAGCYIGGVVYAVGTANPANACQSCQAASTTTWTTVPDGTTCSAGEVCSGGACAPGCSIGGVVVAAGAMNPADACQSCVPGTSAAAWTSAPVGTKCSVGDVCNASGACVADCFIGGMLYAAGATSPNNICQTCQPASSTTTWSNVSTGTGCGNGQICGGGTCGTQCDIGGTVYASGIANPANACQNCQPGVSTSAWTGLSAGTSCGTGEVCNASAACTPGCYVGGMVYASGAANPANACQSCQPTTSTTAFSNVPAGTTCAVGSVCSGAACTAGCYIGTTVYPSATLNPANACQSCQPATTTGAWTNLATGTACGAGMICNVGACAADCDIGGTVYTSAATNPTNPCQSCQPAASTTAFSNVTLGTSCGAGKICAAGACTAACDIGSTFQASGAANPTNACQTCQPAASTTVWTSVANGTSCGNGQLCASGVCGTQCDIGGTIYASGTNNPANDCQSCQPGTSTSAWSNVAAGTTCATGKVCSAGVCTADCFIGGMLYTSGTINPANACQSCQPATATVSWSNLAAGTACATGKVCSAGTCASDCFVSGTLYTSGAANPANACQTCQPATSTTAFTNVATGTTCGTGLICNGGTCAADCDIGGSVTTSGTHNPANACQSCQPATSTTAWTNLANGTSCATGQVCSAGVCASDCYISTTIYTAGTLDPTNACLSCQPATSTTAWTNVATGTSCGNGQICVSGTCGMDCDIGGTVYASGTANPGNACQSCQPGTSTTGWSSVAAGTSCGSGLICTAGTCAADCDIGGSVTTSGTVNSANACQSCQPGTSTTTWSNLPIGTACGAGKVCNLGTCASDCYISGAIYASGALNPSNACQSCQPATSTTGWSSVSTGTSCGTAQYCNAGTCESGCDIGGTVYAAGTSNPSNVCQLCKTSAPTSWTNASSWVSCAANTWCNAGACTGRTPPSCQVAGAGVTACGAAGDSCCAFQSVPTATFYRTYSNTGSGPTSETDQATVSAFHLDKYPVTVGRFRQFVGAWNGGIGFIPAPGSGRQTFLNGGNGLANTGSTGGYELGWVTSNNTYLSPDDTSLASCAPSSTWTASIGSNETLPINCITEPEAYAFCIWDGGFLPSVAEWMDAAAAGSQQREYPWGSTAPGTANQYSIYGCYYPNGMGCSGFANLSPVGSASLGAGLYGQLDLLGNVRTWTLDVNAGGGATGYGNPCSDCANVSSGSFQRTVGAAFSDPAFGLTTPTVSQYVYNGRVDIVGIRCARP